MRARVGVRAMVRARVRVRVLAVKSSSSCHSVNWPLVHWPLELPPALSPVKYWSTTSGPPYPAAKVPLVHMGRKGGTATSASVNEQGGSRPTMRAPSQNFQVRTSVWAAHTDTWKSTVPSSTRGPKGTAEGVATPRTSSPTKAASVPLVWKTPSTDTRIETAKSKPPRPSTEDGTSDGRLQTPQLAPTELTAPLSVSEQAGATGIVEPPPQLQHMATAVKSSSSNAGSQLVEEQPICKNGQG